MFQGKQHKCQQREDLNNEIDEELQRCIEFKNILCTEDSRERRE